MLYFVIKSVSFSNTYNIQAAEQILKNYPWLPSKITLSIDAEENHCKRLEVATKLLNEGGKRI